MKNIINKYIFCLVGVLILAMSAISCNEEVISGLTDSESRAEGAMFDVTLTEREDFKIKQLPVNTKAQVNTDDGWTTSRFNYGDVAGFFCTKGNLSNIEDPDAEFPGMVINGEMYYQGLNGSNYRFGNSAIRLDPAQVVTGARYLYSPYSPLMDDPIDQNSTEGLKLRVEDDGYEKCLDYMYSSGFNLTDGILNPSFSHLFAEIIIIPGEGFNEAKEQQIKVVMTNGYTDIRVRATMSNGVPTGWSQYLFYNGEDTFEAKLAARTWEAWPGAKNKSRDAWYCVVPTLSTSYGSKTSPYQISYIEIVDNYGQVQKVSDFYLELDSGTSGNEKTKNTLSGKRYPLEIILTEVGVVVRPGLIDAWDEPEEISDKRETGIGDYADFEQWAMAYNAYIENNRPEDENTINTLLKYGNGFKSADGDWEWTFYVINDIEFPNNALYKINRLEDTLEGASNYQNFTISNIKQTLIGELGENGYIHNLDFSKIYISSTSEEPIGGLINNISGGNLENCNIILGIVVGNGPVGMISGTVENSTISYCNGTGSLFGTETSEEPAYGLFGTDPINCVFTDNTSDLIFETNQ